MSTSSGAPYIYRTDVEGEGGHHGYYLRMMMSTPLAISEYFGDPTYGGPEQALEAAIMRRDEIMKEIPERYTRGGKGRGNHGNCFGAGITRKVHKRKGVEYPVWVAYYSENGKRHAKEFAVGRYGEEGAKQRAKKWRENNTEHLNHVGVKGEDYGEQA